MKKIGLIIIGAILLTNFAAADYIFLKDGSQIKGTITQVQEDSVSVQTDYGTITIPKARIINTVYGESLNNNADQTVQNKPQKKQNTEENQPSERTKEESWYMSVSFGAGGFRTYDHLYSHIQQYSDKTKEEIEKKAIGYFNYGFYGSLGSSVIAGPSLSIWATSWEESVINYYGNNYKDKYSLTAFLFHFDLKLFANEICNGFFINIAPGIGSINFKRDQNSHSDQFDHNTDLAFGGKAGLGWAFKLKRFDRAITLGFEGFYLSGKFKNADRVKENWTLYGGMVSLGLLW